MSMQDLTEAIAIIDANRTEGFFQVPVILQ
jgi:hypothetical protein